MAEEERIIVDRAKWDNLVALAKAVGSLYNADAPEEDEAQRRRAYAEYERFCDWRHEEPYASGEFADAGAWMTEAQTLLGSAAKKLLLSGSSILAEQIYAFLSKEG